MWNSLFCVVKITHEQAADVSDLKNTIAQLYSVLNVEQHQIERENEFQKTIENIKLELQPLEEVCLNTCVACLNSVVFNMCMFSNKPVCLGPYFLYCPLQTKSDL